MPNSSRPVLSPLKVATALIERSPSFRLGFLEGQAKLPFRYDDLSIANINYERGRHFAALNMDLTLANLMDAMLNGYIV